MASTGAPLLPEPADVDALTAKLSDVYARPPSPPTLAQQFAAFANSPAGQLTAGVSVLGIAFILKRIFR